MSWTAPGSRTALTTSRPKARFWDDIRLQKLWIALQRRPWRSLAVLPGSEPADTMEIAEVLGQIAWTYQGEPTTVLDLRDVSLRLAEYQIRESQQQAESGVRVLIGLRSIAENPASSLVARESDAALLCLELGSTHLQSALQTIEEVGRERIVGSLLVRRHRVRRGRRGWKEQLEEELEPEP
jgi:hypothetical protein